MPILELSHNVCHSNARYGLRLSTIQSRRFPCKPLKNPKADDIYLDNPSI